MPMGSLFGIPVRVSVWYLVLLSYVGFRFNLAVYNSTDGFAQRLAIVVLFNAAFTFSLLAHELSHVLVARRFGSETEEVLMHGIGGFAKLRSLPNTPGGLFLMSAAGPAANLALALGLHVAGQSFDGEPFRVLVAWLVYANLSLGILNLITVLPLDGGQMLHAVLWKLFGDREEAERACLWSAVVIGPILAGAGFQRESPIVVLVGMAALLYGYIRLQKTPVTSA